LISSDFQLARSCSRQRDGSEIFRFLPARTAFSHGMSRMNPIQSAPGFPQTSGQFHFLPLYSIDFCLQAAEIRALGMK